VGLLRRGGRWGLLLAASLLLAWLLDWAALPAALLLGPMLAAIAFGASGARMRVPRWTFVAAQAVVGCLVARAITMSIVLSLARDWMAMLLVVTATVVAGAVVGWVLVRFRVLPGTTAAWGSSPGGASAMIVMAEEFGADVRLVAFMQYLRVVVVVLTASLVSRLLLHVSATATVPARSLAAMPLAVPLVPLLETLAIAAGGALAEGRAAVAAQLLDRARAGRPIPAWLDQQLNIARSRACAADGKTMAALAALGDGSDDPLEAAVTRAHAWAAAGDDGNARRALAPALAADSRPAGRVRLHACLVDARLRYHSGDRTHGRRSLASALRLAEPEQLRLPFALERAWLGPVLRRHPDLAEPHRRLLEPVLP